MDARSYTWFRVTVRVLPKSGYYVHILSDFGNTLLYDGMCPQIKPQQTFKWICRQ